MSKRKVGELVGMTTADVELMALRGMLCKHEVQGVATCSSTHLNRYSDARKHAERLSKMALVGAIPEVDMITREKETAEYRPRGYEDIETVASVFVFTKKSMRRLLFQVAVAACQFPEIISKIERDEV